MPQKKNPDIAELVRGKTGRVYGDLMTLLTAMKGLPLAYNKDMQEDKEAVFDAVDTVRLCLEVLPPMLESAAFHPDNLRKAAAQGFTQRHRLCRLPDEKRRALPGRLSCGGCAGETVRGSGLHFGNLASFRLSGGASGL